MLRSLNAQLKYTVEARDGEAGHLSDFLLDDRTWAVRYAVVDLGKWLPGREVLFAQPGIEGANFESQTLTLNATRAQIEASPDLGENAPVSREYEHYLYEHYRWPAYWAPGFEASALSPDADSPAFKAANPHLRSLRELRGYEILVDDKSVGRVDEFMGYEDTWEVPFFVANVGGWFQKERLMVPTKLIQDISFAGHTMALNISTNTLDALPIYDPKAPEAGRLEICVYDFRGKLLSHEPVDAPTRHK